MQGSSYPTLVLCDAHNHIQDDRLAPYEMQIWETLRREPIRYLVVNGSCEADWPGVYRLAQQHENVVASFGVHPWYVKERSQAWLQNLTGFLDRIPGAIGEIGLDRWVKDYDIKQQEEVFGSQLRLAAERNLPVSVHCLQAWGLLYEVLHKGPRPECGFLLHSFGGPIEMIEPLARLGAYFSLPGYFAAERKNRQRQTFKYVPPDRLLIETDSPDQSLPPERVLYPLPEQESGKPLNHPGNLRAVYQFAAELFDEPLEIIAARVQQNFLRLFSGCIRR